LAQLRGQGADPRAVVVERRGDGGQALLGCPAGGGRVRERQSEPAERDQQPSERGERGQRGVRSCRDSGRQPPGENCQPVNPRQRSDAEPGDPGVATGEPGDAGAARARRGER
jgi:hypothetical protein